MRTWQSPTDKSKMDAARSNGRTNQGSSSSSIFTQEQSPRHSGAEPQLRQKKHSRQTTTTSMGNTITQSPNSWLLRLFQSDYFDIRFAVLYLYKYLKIIGIQNYICLELESYSEDDFMLILPQLWYCFPF